MIFRLFCVSLALCTVLAAPDNDSFSNRTPLDGDSGDFEVYQLDATREPSEPAHTAPPLIGYASVWWTWTAPADGVLALDGEQSDYSTLLYVAIYTGDALSQLQPIAGDSLKKYQPLFASVRAGESYQIAVSFPSDHPPDYSFGQVTPMHFRFYPPPPNDLFANRTVVTGSIIPLNGYTVGATREPGEPPHGDLPLNNSVWWQWTPSEDGLVLIEGTPTFRGTLRPYIGSEANQLIPVPLSAARDRFEVHSGQTVQIAVVPYDPTVAGPVPLTLVFSPLRVFLPASAFPDDENGNVTLRLANFPQTATRVDVDLLTRPTASFPLASSLTLTNLPPGAYDPEIEAIDPIAGHRFLGSGVHFVVSGGADSFANAREAAGHPEIGGDFTVASGEPGEPALPPGATGSVWWRWTASENGVVRLENTAAAPVSRDVFTGESLENLQPVAYQNAASPADNLCIFSVQKGTAYYIRLYETGPPTSWASTHFQFLPILPNDDFANAEPLSGSDQIILPRGVASCEPSEPGPCAAEAGSRWYRFIPPADGAALLKLDAWFSLQDRTAVSIYTGDSLPNLSQVFAPQLTGSVALSAGTPCYIRIETPNSYPETLHITFQFDFVPRPPNDNVAEAILVPSAMTGILQGTCDMATTEPGQPPNVSGPGSVWYRFVAPAEGALAVRVTSILTNVNDDPYSPQLAFVRGTNLSSLTWDDSQFRSGNVAATRLKGGEQALFSVWNNFPPNALFTRTAFALDYYFVPRPTNDTFAGGIELPGLTLRAASPLWNATPAKGPDYPGVSANRSLWWKWFAPADGVLNVHVRGGDLSAFAGANLTNLTIVRSFPSAPYNPDTIQIPVTRSNWYNLRLSTSEFAPLGSPFDPVNPGSLSVASLQAEFSTLRLTSPTNSVFAFGAPVTLQIPPPDPAIDGNISLVSFVTLTNFILGPERLPLAPPSAAPYRLVLTNLFPAAYSLQALATNEAGQSLFSTPALIRITPENDAFTNATPILGGTLDVDAILSGSSTEPKEPFVSFNYGSVWYNWRPIAPGPVRLHFIPRPYTADVRVLTGNALANLQSIATLDTPFNAFPASNYFIRVSGPSSDPGTLLAGTLQIRQTTISATPTNLTSFPSGQPISIDITTTESPDRFNQATVQLDQAVPVALAAPAFHYAFANIPPGPHQLTFLADFSTGEPALRITNTIYVATPNDSFSNRVLVPFSSGQIPGSTFGATSESGLPYAPADLWYQWIAPADGLLFLSAAPPVPGISGLAVYQGDQLTNLAPQPNRINRPFLPSERGWQVQSNQTYVIAVIGSGDPLAGADFKLQFTFQPAGPNDAFANRISLFGPEGQVDGNLTLATTEPDEQPYPLFSQPTATAWWTWTPPATGLLEIYYPGADPQNPISSQTVVPWRGDALGALKSLPLAEDLGPFAFGSAYYRVEAGVPLQLSLVSGLDDLDIPWAWRLFTPPSNDNFTNRTPLAGHAVSVSGTTLGASLEPNEQPVYGAASTWWTWTSDSDADLWITVTNGGAPLRVQIFTGSDLASLQLFGIGQSQTTFRIPVRTGITYQFMISPEHLPGADYQLNLALGYGTLPNDTFAAAQPLDPSGGSIVADNRRATREFHEPLHAGHFGGRSLWYTWNAEKSGTLELDAPAANYLLLAAYTGDAVTNLHEVASSYIEQSGSLKFRVQAGQQYKIALDNAWGYGAETLLAFGQTQLNVAFSADPSSPSHLSAALSTEGTLILTADSAALTVLETSTDLREWVPVQSAPTSPLTWELKTNSEPARFFRLRSQP